MARDHEFLIGRNDVETDATISRGDRRGGCRIGLGIERTPKPGEPLHDACSGGRPPPQAGGGLPAARAGGGGGSPPIPAVNTKASSPPRAAASRPALSPTR